MKERVRKERKKREEKGMGEICERGEARRGEASPLNPPLSPILAGWLACWLFFGGDSHARVTLFAVSSSPL